MPYVLGHIFGGARRGCDPASPPTSPCCCPDPRRTAGALRADAVEHQNSSVFLARAEDLSIGVGSLEHLLYWLCS